MTAEELLSFFKTLYPATSGKKDRAKLPTITPMPLHRRANLERYLLAQRFAGLPSVQIFEKPLEEWSDVDLEDLHRIMLAEIAAKEARQRIQKVDTILSESVTAAISAIHESWKA